jgi:hypothetical protein
MDEGILREQIAYLLKGGGAHRSPRDVLAPLSFTDAAKTKEEIVHSIWELVEHMRICQWDILEFTLDPNHASPDWPDGYWPKSPSPADNDAWADSKSGFFSDLDRAVSLALDRSIDITGTIVHGSGQTVLRELLLIADHNAYHLGQVQDLLS